MEGFVGIFKFILKNQGTDTVATKVPIEGDLNKVDSKVWPTITNIFKNAWISAFSESVDSEIEFKDVLDKGKEEEKKRRSKFLFETILKKHKSNLIDLCFFVSI